MDVLSPTDALIGLGLTAPMLQQLLTRERYAGESPMRVVEVRRDLVCLHDGVREVQARVPPSLVERLDNDDVAVGDWVLADEPAPGSWRVVERIAPLTQIARRTNDGRGAARRQVLVSNVDTTLLVMGLDHDYNLRRLERYLALARLAGAYHAGAFPEPALAPIVERHHPAAPLDGSRAVSIDGMSLVDLVLPVLSPPPRA